MREAETACEFHGHPVARGGDVWFSPWIVHRDPRRYDVGAPRPGLELPAIVATVLVRWRLEPVAGREPRAATPSVD